MQSPEMTAPHDPRESARALLDWYDRHARRLPWRVPPHMSRHGVLPDPYHVWLSEVMLQQTRVEAVQAHFRDFLARWPDVHALARASDEDVMAAWAGLGYYSRARYLKRCAETVSVEMAGKFPSASAQLRLLPGIGDYTSAAIAAIAFGEPVAVVDGNVERVASRLFRLSDSGPALKEATRRLIQPMTPRQRAGDFAQAMMDLGATVCTPRNPGCLSCPLRQGCAASLAGRAQDYPVKAKKAEKPLRRGAAFVAEDANGAILLRRRPPSGLLGGMNEPPTTAWTAARDGETTPQAAPFAAPWRHCGTVRHTFTHFHLELEIYHARLMDRGTPGNWAPRGSLEGQALPTLMKKAISAAIPSAFGAPKGRTRG
jgi:A/G-specific adenine glycosylase